MWHIHNLRTITWTIRRSRIVTSRQNIKRGKERWCALVSIESTIPKGTSKKVFEILNHRLHVVHALHRWYALEEKVKKIEDKDNNSQYN
jgi:hypothetical protein